MNFLKSIFDSEIVRVLIIFIVLDTILGILRAIKEKKINSTIGIDGIIRKTGMLICVFFLSMVDYVIHIDLIGFIPETLKTTLSLGDVGIASLFIFIFIIFEILSVIKNAILCKLPIPKKLQSYLEKIMLEFTSEIKKEGE